MPKAPITSRTLLWERLSDETIHQLDWNLVGTSLGAMIEPRVLLRESGNIQNEDLFDSSYTDMLLLQSDAMYAQTGFAGSQWAHYRANDPGVE